MKTNKLMIWLGTFLLITCFVSCATREEHSFCENYTNKDSLIQRILTEYEEEAYLATHPSAFSSEVNLSPQITFQVNGVNIGTPYRVEYEGGHGVFYPVEKNRGRMVNWPGDSNMPMIISGYLSGDNKPAYHLRYMNDTRMDLIHIKFDKKNAQEFLQKYQRQFYPH